ncbi:coenzyme Q-binding protein COQ10 [uncultured Gammaproteobacteria bacterium]
MAYRVVKGGLPFSCAQLFDLIVDVESYPRFVPWWEAVRVKDRENGRYRTDQVVRFPWFKQTFSTVTTYERPHRIEVVAQKGALGTFSLAWKLNDADDGTATVDLTVEVSGSVLPVRKVAEALSRDVVQMLLTAFEGEAARVYRNPSAETTTVP